MQKSTQSIAGMSVGVFILAGTAWAAELHVPAHYGSIQSAINAADDGDEVVVAPGTYHETIDFLSKGLTVRSSHGPDVTVIDGSDLEDSVVTIRDTGMKAARLAGFTIRNGMGQPGPGGTQGGGVYIYYGGPVLENLVIDGNRAGAGGGVAMYGAWPVITDCMICDNISDGYGRYCAGGLYAKMSVVRIANTRFCNNIAQSSASGGGALFTLSTVTLVNSEFVGNEGLVGGALVNNSTDLDMVNCTLVGNVARAGGGAIVVEAQSNRWSKMSNCIIWDNHDESPSSFDSLFILDDAHTVVRHSVVESEWHFLGEGNLDMDPKFVDAENGDFRLATASPCIDAGLVDALPEDVSTDLLGNDRVIGDSVDMGAVEAVDVGEPLIGACCFADGTCAELEPADCAAFGGEFQGDGVSCNDADCPQPQIDADFNDDGWVDSWDLFHLLSQWGRTNSACDVDDDGMVNANDLHLLLAAWGPQG